MHPQDVGVAQRVGGRAGSRLRNLGQRVHLLRDRGDDGQVVALDLTGEVLPVALDGPGVAGLLAQRDDAVPALEVDAHLTVVEDEVLADLDVGVVLADLGLGGGGEHDGEQDESLHGSSEACVLGVA